MGLFSFGNKNKNEGGIMDVIRCDEDDYLIWKWSPNGVKSFKENAIRYGSSLRVKAGEVAVFVYKDGDKMMDFIEGPFDQIIKTANFPVLSSIVGSAYGGASPFQAEIYFINLAGSVKLDYYVDWFNISDPRNSDYSIPVQVKGSILFSIRDYKRFIENYRLRHFEIDDLKSMVGGIISEVIIDSVSNAVKELKSLLEISAITTKIKSSVEEILRPELEENFALKLNRFVLNKITLDENSKNYQELLDLGNKRLVSMGIYECEIAKRNMDDMQKIGKENMAESLRIQREETQRQQKLSTESAYLGAHQLNIQGDVARTAAESLGMMNANIGFGDVGGMNPAGMMTGMMLGGTIGGGMANMMGNMMNGMNQQQPPAPPAAAITQYYIAINGQQSGPYNVAQLQQLLQAGQFTGTTYVWKQGMAGWELASSIPELASLFGAVPPPPPPFPPTL